VNFELIFFFVLALVAIGGGVLMINLNNVVHMVVSLVFTFLSIAGLYVLLSAEFVAVVQILIYSGAITIIMLFGIMLTKHDDQTSNSAGKLRYFLVSIGIVGFFAIVFFGINNADFGQQAATLHENNTQQIGIELFSKYIIPFELTSVLLLVALVGAIVLARKDDDEEEASENE
jgi:NADH-quinone oxidoreductase subunit J